VDPRRTALAAQLRRHEMADDDERAHGRRMLSLLDSNGDPFTRDHFAPGHFTASAFVLSPDESELLLILHAKLGMWLQPGGHVEPGDADLAEAARREVAEEVALEGLTLLSDGPLDLDIHRIPARSVEPEHEHFDVRFLFRAAHRAFREGEEIRGARWVPLHRVFQLHSDESVRRAVRKLRALGSAS